MSVGTTAVELDSELLERLRQRSPGKSDREKPYFRARLNALEAMEAVEAYVELRGGWTHRADEPAGQRSRMTSSRNGAVGLAGVSGTASFARLDAAGVPAIERLAHLRLSVLRFEG